MTTPEPITNWQVQQLDDLSGKRYLITGGNSGIGYEAAAHLRRANADVFIASRSSSKGTQAVTSLAQMTAHPGYSATNLQSSGPTGFYKRLYKVTNALMAQSAADGAMSEVLAAAGTQAKNGAYYGPTKLGESRGPVGDSRISDAARNEQNASRLWSLSEELLGVTFTIS